MPYQILDVGIKTKDTDIIMKLILHFERLFEKQSLFFNLEPKIDDDIKLSFLENVQESVNLANGLPECMR